MGWPTDPVRKAQALETFRAAQRRRWENADEERARLRVMAEAQWTPEARARMAELKRRQYQENPLLRQMVADGTREWARSRDGQDFYVRKGEAERLHRPVIAAIARVRDIRRTFNARKRTAKTARLDLIRARASQLRNGTTQANGV